MLTLSNSHLSVSILDPVADVNRLGSRYCTGGYIWQIEERCLGPLLAGRHYPEPNPAPFDGQGAPEAFVTPLGREECGVGETVTVIGVGEVRRTSAITPFHVRDNPEVARFCRWEIAAGPQAISMWTNQRSAGCEISLARSVLLDGRTVVSLTEAVNLSESPLPLRWFAHPFFPLNRDRRCLRPLLSWSVPDNPGYLRSDGGTLYMSEEYDWRQGLFQQLCIEPGTAFAAEVFHPLLPSVKVSADYPLESLPVWANDRTFSPEPYMCAKVPPGGRYQWKIEYTFQ